LGRPAALIEHQRARCSTPTTSPAGDAVSEAHPHRFSGAHAGAAIRRQRAQSRRARSVPASRKLRERRSQQAIAVERAFAVDGRQIGDRLRNALACRRGNRRIVQPDAYDRQRGSGASPDISIRMPPILQ
jgi:hypothetical protein